MSDVKNDLDRRLTLGAVIAISISSMLGSGIFVLPGIAIAATGPSAWLAYLLAGVCALPAAVSKAELATAMPASGGTYVYLERTFGPWVGTLSGIGLWLSLLLKSAFALIGIGAYLGVLVNWPLQAVSLALLIIIVALNIVGVGKVGLTIVIIVITSLSGLGFLGIFGAFSIEPLRFDPFLTGGVPGLVSAAALVFISYAGVTKVAAIAEEVIQPERNIPKGIIISLAIVMFMYCFVTLVLVGVVDHKLLAGDLHPIHTLSVALGGNIFGIVAAVIAILTMASMANSGVLAASRFPFAMSRDHLMPAAMGTISRKFLTPHTAILTSGVVVAASIILFDVEKIAKLASAFIIAIYILENIAVMVLRETRVQWYAPSFRVPMYPYVQIFGIVSGAFLLASMGTPTVIALVSVAVPGTIMYVFYSRHRTERKGVVGVRVRRKELEQPLSPTLSDDTLDANVVVPLFGDERSPEMLVEIGGALAAGNKIEVVHVTEVPEQSDVEDVDAIESGAINALRRRINTIAKKRSLDLDFDHIGSHDIYQTVHAISSRLHCQWLVKEWGGRTHGALTMHKQMGWLEDHLPCNVMTFRDAGIRYVTKIMLLSAGGQPDDLVLNTATQLADSLGAELWVCTFLPNSADENIKRSVAKNLEKLKSRSSVKLMTAILRGKEELDAIIDASVDFDLVILRAEKYPDLWNRMFGSPQDKLIERATCSVISVQEYRPIPLQ